jgi:hypothetical protein
MRPLALALLSALALAGCRPTECELLGDRLCRCAPTGVTHASCVQGVKTEVDRVNPNGSAEQACHDALGTCWPPSKDPITGEAIDPPIAFCDWLSGRCGKAACKISEEDYQTLLDTPLDPANPDGPRVCFR